MIDRDIDTDAVPSGGVISEGRNIVVVIGIDRYREWPVLSNAVSDAAGALRAFLRLGFEQIMEPLIDDAATGDVIRRLVTDDLATLGAGDSLILFFAGHGHTRTRMFQSGAVQTGYIIPVDGNRPSGHAATWLRLMLPVPAPGSIDPSVRPWRSIVSCEPDEHELDVENIPPPAVHWRGLHSTAIQTLTQRAALCVAALDDHASQEACDQLAEMLEELGYIALSREHHDRRIDAFRPTKMPFRFFYTIREIAARLYEINVIHGDMTTSNFLYDEQQRTAVISDVGTTCFLKRPITMEEHAADVGLMKLTCSFEEWEAVKLGYRNRAPDRAARLFQLI
jgi:hypothetical protein